MDPQLQRLSDHPEANEFIRRRASLTLLFPLALGGAFFVIVFLAGYQRPLFGVTILGDRVAVGTLLAMAYMALCVVMNAVYMRLYERRLTRLREKILKETRE